MGRLEGMWGGLGAIVGVLERSFGEWGSSWGVLWVFWEGLGILMEVRSEPREGQIPWVNVAWDGGGATWRSGEWNCRFGVAWGRLQRGRLSHA